jgi:hypothetical protein
VHNEINACPTFAEKVDYARNAWKNRVNNAAFDEIKNKLVKMCVHNTICNYCEATLATDIEHILPKLFFPELAFAWDNYLLACKTCNTAFKLDNIAVFLPGSGINLFRVPRGTQPPSGNVAMINIRHENPANLIDLDLGTGVFYEKFPLGTMEYEKAKYTIDEALFLNIRDDLRESREVTFKEQYQNLRYATLIFESESLEEIGHIINNHEPIIVIDPVIGVRRVKAELLVNIRKAIRNKRHPTVWAEMKNQRFLFPRLNDLFNRYPQALNW